MLNIRSIIYGSIASGRCRKLLQSWMICLNDDVEIVCDHRRVWRRLSVIPEKSVLSMRQSLSKVNSIAPTFSSRLSSSNSCAVIMSSSDDSLDIELDSELFQEPPGYFLPPLPYTSTKFTLISGQAINLRLVGHNPLWVLTSSLWRLFARQLL